MASIQPRNAHGEWTDGEGAPIKRGDQVFIKGGKHKGEGARITGQQDRDHFLAQSPVGEPMVLHRNEVAAVQATKPHGRQLGIRNGRP